LTRASTRLDGLRALIEIEGHTFEADLAEGVDLSIPMSFSGTDPNLYGIPPAEQSVFEAGGMVGDTRQGGTCNVDTIRLTPHCHGTHTECVGHLTDERIMIGEIVPSGLITCNVVSIQPRALQSVGESSRPALTPDEESDLGITAQALKDGLKGCDAAWLDAIIIRTLPNSSVKKEATYLDNSAPYFSIEAIDYLKQLGVQHILVDLPSLDRLHDEGQMAAHRRWWNIAVDSHDTPTGLARTRTITELIFVPDDVLDGIGFVALQIPPFRSDAAPSRPIFYAAHSVSQT